MERTCWYRKRVRKQWYFVVNYICKACGVISACFRYNMDKTLAWCTSASCRQQYIHKLIDSKLRFRKKRGRCKAWV